MTTTSAPLPLSITPTLVMLEKCRTIPELRQIHASVIKSGLVSHTFVMSKLVSFCSLSGVSGGGLDYAASIFSRIQEPNFFIFFTIIRAFADSPNPLESVILYSQMLISLEKFYGLEFSLPSVLKACYALNHRPKKALDLFWEMLGSGIQPDPAAIVSVLSAIADLGFIEEDMYSKCGYIENAFDVFKAISHRRIIGDWNSMISGLAIHGLSKEALDIFHDMERMEIQPNEITFLGVLTACSHGGLVQEGQLCFKIMCENCKIIPKIQHYGCMIDLYGRAGRLEDAIRILQEMPFEPDVLAWKAILSACLKHGQIENGRFAAFRAIELAPEDSSCYILLSNIYAKAGRWDDVAKIRSMMRERGIKKVPGCSSILLNGQIHEFLVGKEMDSRVLEKLQEMVFGLKLEGYEPDLNQVLVDVEEEEKENILCFHSEKMALAFGLINVSKGAPIHIVKNLRVCSDCHSFIKLASKVHKHQIILRDQNRFHHFKDGSCSCNEYW
ncbi:Pentatricopeptide repeat [Macleaya cordata]|uniref:Pentatricopeptide repeat n=1 Tax=Macleaya cordata TaxID=56857 RepID=A0A200Q681_MACCD|nr:Pentatricopeptide repeat [Macleaya cordata]